MIDSRQLTATQNTLFIAIKSAQNDGHNYIDTLYKQGVKLFLVSQLPLDYKNYTNAQFILVKNTIKALQQLAYYHRSKFKNMVIGITGSNGKTIVKEWLTQLLQNEFKICSNPKSYNSQIGVPLSVWNLNTQKDTLGIFEAGISTSNEMGHLSDIINPTIGILTSIGVAHSEGFKSINEKILEKIKLFQYCEIVVINTLQNNDLTYDLKFIKQQLKCKTISIGTSNDFELQVLSINNEIKGSMIQFKYLNKQHTLQIPFSDLASVYNCLTCWVVLKHFKISLKNIAKRFSLLSPVEMRMELKQGRNHNIVINDFYNNDLNALKIALQFQKQQKRNNKNILILSSITQSGLDLKNLYNSVNELLTEFKIDLLIGIGDDIIKHKLCFKTQHLLFNTTDEFIKTYSTGKIEPFKNSTILLKGSPTFQFERISKLLQEKSHNTVLEISLNKISHNINYFKSQLNAGTKIMCIVKATGYGLGGNEIANTLKHSNINYLAVAYTDEGVMLRKSGVTLPIMVMNPEENSFTDLVFNQLEPEIYSFKLLNTFIEFVNDAKVQAPYPIHIKLDTGMNRLGFNSKDVNQISQIILTSNTLKVKSVFSHFAGSDSKEFDTFSKQQLSQFNDCSSALEHKLNYKIIKHLCNTAAITRHKNAHFDMVRLGIGMYGISGDTKIEKHLEFTTTLKTKISQLKIVEKGSTIGYNSKNKLTKTKTIAIIPIGYADGFNRALGNGKHHVLIKNSACPTIGNICMDMCMIDVTQINCKEDDEVIIYNNRKTFDELANKLQTIPYEILTNNSERIKRIYITES